MNSAINNLPEDSASLKKLLIESYNLNKSLEQENKQYKSRCNYLEQELRLFKDRMFNKKSEKFTEDELLQGRMFDEVEANAKSEKTETVKVKSYRRKKGGKKKLPDSLPRIEIIHDIPEEDKQCGCGCKKIIIGTVESEKLDIIPAKIVVEKHIRYKYACEDPECIECDKGAVQTAPMPPQLLPQGIATPGLVAYITAGKYIDGTPLYRLEKIFSRFGFDLSRQTMCNWLMKTYEKTKPLINLMWKDILTHQLVGIDETHVQVLKEPGRKNSTKSFMWVFCGQDRSSPVVLYDYRETRSGDFLKDFLENYNGAIQTDKYKGYDKIAFFENIIHALCWAHARRKFCDAEKAEGSSDFISEVLDLIGNLYGVEKIIRKNNFSNKDILKIRKEKSEPVLEELKELLLSKHGTVPPKSSLGKAISYTLEAWDKLIVYCENPHIKIDNNFVENKIRPFTIGRKNWIFSGSPRGANASAAFYSLIETAKANDLEPYWYLKYAFSKLPYCQSEKDYEKLLPYNLTMEVIKKNF